MTKDEWIQKAKALMFDCIFCVDSGNLKNELEDLIEEGGGYDPHTEDCDSELNWSKTDSLKGLKDLADRIKNMPLKQFLSIIDSNPVETTEYDALLEKLITNKEKG